MAEENTSGNTPVTANAGSDGAAKPVNASKKPKTARQIERERERRRRRRRKNSQNNLTGKDVPLVLNETAPVIKGTNEVPLPPGDLNLEEIKDNSENAPLVQEMAPGLNQAEDIKIPESEEMPSPPESLEVIEPNSDDDTSMSEPDALRTVDEGTTDLTEEKPEDAPNPWESLVKGEPVNTLSESPSVSIDQPVSAGLEPEVSEPESIRPVEEVVTSPAEEVTVEEPETPTPETTKEEVSILEETVPLVQPTVENFSASNDEIVHEDVLKEENIKKAQEISQNLLEEEALPDELPVKQGLMGQFFDWLAHKSAQRKMAKSQAQSVVTESNTAEKAKSTIDLTRIVELLKKFAGVLVLVVVIVGAFWLGSALKVYDRVIGFLTPSVDQSKEVLAMGDNSQVLVDEALIKKLGFRTARLFGQNAGNQNDLVYNVFFNAAYFGKLKEPVFYGETGVSAALYYGFGRDFVSVKNKFIYYVNFLNKLDNANTVVISDVLKGKLRRDDALDKYIVQSKALFEEGNLLRKEINIQIDDLQIAVNSLTPDKDRYEADFFASINAYDGNTADLTIAKFIESSQKMVELKAKLAAMNKLSGLYEDKLITLKLRYEALEKNREALINDVQVTETPGFNLNLVKKDI